MHYILYVIKQCTICIRYIIWKLQREEFILFGNHTLLTSGINAHSFIAAAIIIRIVGARNVTTIRRTFLTESADAVTQLPVHQCREPIYKTKAF